MKYAQTIKNIETKLPLWAKTAIVLIGLAACTWIWSLVYLELHK